MKILTHVCCAPCFTYPHKRMLEEGHDVTAFFYNPNIHPYQEYKNRLLSVEKYVELKGTKVIYDNNYEIENYLRGSTFCRRTMRHSATQRDLKKPQKWQDNWNLMLLRPRFSFPHTRNMIHLSGQGKK